MKKLFLRGFFSVCVVCFWSFAAFAETGAYIEAGPVGAFQLDGPNRDFQPGVGFQLQSGYDWDKIGIRGNFIITTQDDDAPLGGLDSGVEMVHVGFDVKLRLMGFAGKTDFPFQPYVLAGIGPYFLTEGSIEDDDNAGGMGGSLGIGFDWRILEFLSLGIENNYHFIGLIEDRPTQTFIVENDELNGFSIFMTTVMGKVVFHF